MTEVGTQTKAITHLTLKKNSKFHLMAKVTLYRYCECFEYKIFIAGKMHPSTGTITAHTIACYHLIFHKSNGMQRDRCEIIPDGFD